MNRYVAFLAGINLGRRRLKMDALREHFERMKFADVETILASGNVIFSTRKRNAGEIERGIERDLEAALGYAVDTYVRNFDELHAVLALSSGGTPATSDRGSSVQIMFLKEVLPKSVAARLSKVKTPNDRFVVAGREIYWHVAGRLSDSQIWKSPEVQALNLPKSTTRNRNTIEKIVRQCASVA